MDSVHVCDGGVTESGGSPDKRTKAVKKRTFSSTAINLSHLEEEEEEN